MQSKGVPTTDDKPKYAYTAEASGEMNAKYCTFYGVCETANHREHCCCDYSRCENFFTAYESCTGRVLAIRKGGAFVQHIAVSFIDFLIFEMCM